MFSNFTNTSSDLTKTARKTGPKKQKSAMAEGLKNLPRLS